MYPFWDDGFWKDACRIREAIRTNHIPNPNGYQKIWIRCFNKEEVEGIKNYLTEEEQSLVIFTWTEFG